MSMTRKRLSVYISIGIVIALIIGIGIASVYGESANSPAKLLNLGEKYLLELNYEQAVVQFLKVIEIEPMNERAYLGAAESYLGLGQTDRAVAILEQGLEALPDSEPIRLMLGAWANLNGRDYFSLTHVELLGFQYKARTIYDLTSLGEGELAAFEAGPSSGEGDWFRRGSSDSITGFAAFTKDGMFYHMDLNGNIIDATVFGAPAIRLYGHDIDEISLLDVLQAFRISNPDVLAFLENPTEEFWSTRQPDYSDNGEPYYTLPIYTSEPDLNGIQYHANLTWQSSGLICLSYTVKLENGDVIDYAFVAFDNDATALECSSDIRYVVAR